VNTIFFVSDPSRLPPLTCFSIHFPLFTSNFLIRHPRVVLSPIWKPLFLRATIGSHLDVKLTFPCSSRLRWVLTTPSSCFLTSVYFFSYPFDILVPSFKKEVPPIQLEGQCHSSLHLSFLSARELTPRSVPTRPFRRPFSPLVFFLSERSPSVPHIGLKYSQSCDGCPRPRFFPLLATTPIYSSSFFFLF